MRLSRRRNCGRRPSAFEVQQVQILLWLRRIDEVRRETADAERRAAQLEAELQRMTQAHNEREEDLDRKMDNLNRHAV